MGYRMDDSRWIHSSCGTESSGYTCHQHGAEAVCIAQALSIAGYTTLSPDRVIQRFNNRGTWTLLSDGRGPGLVDMYRIAEAYPQIVRGGSSFTLVGGTWGRFNLTLLLVGDLYFNPYTGEFDTAPPAGWLPNSRVQTFSIRPSA